MNSLLFFACVCSFFFTLHFTSTRNFSANPTGQDRASDCLWLSYLLELNHNKLSFATTNLDVTIILNIKICFSLFFKMCNFESDITKIHGFRKYNLKCQFQLGAGHTNRLTYKWSIEAQRVCVASSEPGDMVDNQGSGKKHKMNAFWSVESFKVWIFWCLV